MVNYVGPTPYGSFNALNITAATVVKATRGVVVTVAVIVSGTTDGAVYDSASTTGNSAANQVAVVPSSGPASDNIQVHMVCGTGITVVPGTGQTLAISYM